LKPGDFRGHSPGTLSTRTTARWNGRRLALFVWPSLASRALVPPRGSAGVVEAGPRQVREEIRPGSAGSPPRSRHGRRARPWPRDTPAAGLRRGAFVIFFTLTGCNTGGHGSRRFSKIVNISTISALTREGGIGTLRDRFALRNAPFPMVFARDEIVKEVANRPRAAK